MATTGAVYSRTLVSKKQIINQGVALDEREKRGLSKLQMAEVLGIEGPHGEQILSDFESGFRPVKGPTLRLYQYLNRGRWESCELLDVPKWAVVMGGPAQECMLHHNEWPRFIGRAYREELHPHQWRFKKAGMPVFVMDERTGYKQLVVAWVDHVPDGFDAEDLLEEGLRYLEDGLRQAAAEASSGK